MKCGKCGHMPDQHTQGKSGMTGCRECFDSEQDKRTRITKTGFFLHEWQEFNQLGNRVL